MGEGGGERTNGRPVMPLPLPLVCGGRGIAGLGGKRVVGGAGGMGRGGEGAGDRGGGEGKSDCCCGAATRLFFLTG